MKPKKRKRHFVLNFFACFLIPVYTISFAGSTEWFGSNFSIIAVTGWDRYQGFLYWGLLAGGYFFVVVNRLAFSMPGQWLRLTVSWAGTDRLSGPGICPGHPLSARLLSAVCRSPCGTGRRSLCPADAGPSGAPAGPVPQLAGTVWPVACNLGPDRIGVRRSVSHSRNGIHRAGGILHHFHSPTVRKLYLLRENEW